MRGQPSRFHPPPIGNFYFLVLSVNVWFLWFPYFFKLNDIPKEIFFYPLLPGGGWGVCVLPRVAQDGGVVKRPPPVAVRLVDVGAVLEEELAGCQGVLASRWDVSGTSFTSPPPPTPVIGHVTALTTDTAWINGVLDSSGALTQLTSAPWARASAMTGKFCRAAER